MQELLGDAPKNFPLDRREFRSIDLVEGTAHKGYWIYSCNPGDTVSEIGELKGDRTNASWAAKRGRSTRDTAGELNALLSLINWVSGRGQTEEMIIASPIGALGVYARHGDEGSMVININKEWVGLLIATDCDMTIMTPASVIVADVKQITGGRIKLA
jgi:hypothetical protein